MAIRTFDVRAWLDDKRIPYSESGKNISQGWIGLACPFCGDHSTHLGINLDSKATKCWRCPAKGIMSLVMHIEACHIRAAYDILGRYQDPGLIGTSRPVAHTRGDTLGFPETFTKDFPDPHTSFMQRRNFLPSQKYITLYDLYACHIDPDWSYRLIAPIYLRNRMVSFVARDVTDLSDMPYINCPNKDSIIPVKSTLYNVDSVQDTVLIVEGILDVWRIGKGAVCTFGTAWTKEQVALLTNLPHGPLKSAYVMFDAEEEAQEQADSLALALASFVRRVEVLELTLGDPADLTEDEVKELKREIFGS
jgi:hypothetical protein